MGLIKDIKAFEVIVGKELHIVADGVLHVWKAGTKFLNTELGVPVSAVENNFSSAVKIVAEDATKATAIAGEVASGVKSVASSTIAAAKTLSIQVVDTVEEKPLQA